VTPYLEPPLRERFDRWLAEAIARYAPPLAFAEVRKGVQALSALWVEHRAEGELAARAVRGAGKRAALATYFAPLHFLTAYHAGPAPGAARPGAVRRVLDLGCGSGATGAAIAARLTAALRDAVPPAGASRDESPRVIGLDVSGWALSEARHTYAGFGLDARTRRARLPEALPRAVSGDLIALGWAVNELDPAARSELRARLARALDAGAALFVAEPLSTRVSPWWDDWARSLEPHGARCEIVRFELERPAWIESLDRASRLDHRTLGARVLRAPST
jgi:SAM-dependent methyltransferase